jgi:hypothetical protein
VSGTSGQICLDMDDMDQSEPIFRQVSVAERLAQLTSQRAYMYIQRLTQPLPNSSCCWPCRNPCLFDVELDSKSVTVLTNQIN